MCISEGAADLFVHIVEEIAEEARVADGAMLVPQQAFHRFPFAIHCLIDFKEGDAFPAGCDAEAALWTPYRMDEPAPGEPLEDLGEVVA